MYAIAFIDNNKENFLKITTDSVTGELIYYDNKNSKWKPIPNFMVEASCNDDEDHLPDGTYDEETGLELYYDEESGKCKSR
jgi:hypothetical protein|tara:strand:+ start:858 stop:1100 length:243 start_codon:yes stop_codon:yes gene_type:complete